MTKINIIKYTGEIAIDCRANGYHWHHISEIREKKMLILQC